MKTARTGWPEKKAERTAIMKRKQPKQTRRATQNSRPKLNSIFTHFIALAPSGRVVKTNHRVVSIEKSILSGWCARYLTGLSRQWPSRLNSDRPIRRG